MKSTRITCAALAGSLLVCGCAGVVSRDATLPVAVVPVAWANPEGAAQSGQAPTALSQWWQRFGDSGLTALITEALAAGTDVRIAQANLQQARALRDVKSAGLLAGVTGSTSAQLSKSGNAPASNSYAAGFDASWEPDIFGGNRSALDAAQADIRVAVAGLANVQISLAAEVAVTYIELRGLQARLAIARSNLAAQTETLQIARWRMQAGLASSLDVEQAVAASEQTRAQIPALETSLTQAYSSLAVLTNRAPGALQSTLAAGIVPLPDGGLTLAFPAATLRQRPDVRAAEHRISAALATVAQADAQRYPSFRISGSLGLRALTLGTLTDGASLVRSLLASVSVPLFDGGVAQAQVRVQEAALAQARVNYQAAVLTALKDVEDALTSLQGNRERLARLQGAADAAANADLLARQRYASGLIDFRAVLETQRTLLSTQDGVESTRASLAADHVRLYKSLGGGWVPEAQAAEPDQTSALKQSST
jgi:NodT family efflux transporter outer membrane factor (OMF) lipoprotein